VLRLADHERRAYANDALRLPQDDLDATRSIAALACDLDRARRRLDPVQAHDAALDLRDRLLRDDDDVVVLELDAIEHERGEVVALAQLGQVAHGQDGDARHSPTMRMPA
jgi:hypothetical protein